MLQLIQPIVSTLIGLALSIYGLFHAANYYPADHGLVELWQMIPAISRLGLFMVGLTAVVVGIALLCTGLYASRRQYRHLRQMLSPRNDPRNDPRNHHGEDMDEDYPPYYPGGHYRY